MFKLFIKNVGLMSTAPIITQILGFIVTPIISRIYTPNDFGLFAVYASIIGPIGVFSTMGYNSPIIITRSNSESNNLFFLCIVFSIIVAFLSSFIVFFSDDIINLFKIESDSLILSKYFYIIPIALLFHGFYMSFRYLNLRHKRYKFIALGNIFRFVTNNGILLIAGFFNVASVLFLILGDLFGGILCLSVLCIIIIPLNINDFFKSISLNSLLAVAKRYSKFPIYITTNDFISRFLSQAPVYILSIYFSQAVIGFYALGLRLLTMPINLIGNSIGEVFFQNISELKNEKVLLDFVFKNLVIFGIPIFSLIAILGEDIFSFFLGSQWSEAGIYAQILSLFLFVKFITIPSNYLTLKFEKQEYSIILNITSLLVSIASLTIGGVKNDVFLSFILFSLSNSLVYSIYGFGFMVYAGLSAKNILITLCTTLIKCIPIILIIIFIDIIFINQFLAVLISTLCVMLYYIYIIINIPELRNFITKIKFFNKFLKNK